MAAKKQNNIKQFHHTATHFSNGLSQKNLGRQISTMVEPPARQLPELERCGLTLPGLWLDALG